jgi:hypothetical protein
MGAIQPKAEWVTSDETGEFVCKDCSYTSSNAEFLKKHIDSYHEGEHSFVLYMTCEGSIDGRNELLQLVDFNYIDCTGGQAACDDGDLQTFGDQLVNASQKTGHKLFQVYRMYDPGLGLDFPQWWFDAGLDAGVFEKYDLPTDVDAGFTNG